jgi:putative acetyltransferase
VEGHDATILILSPLAVQPERQRQGVGTGDPRYYSRFGFRRASELGLERPHEKTPEYAFQALPLAGYDSGLRGRVVYPPPFQKVM